MFQSERQTIFYYPVSPSEKYSVFAVRWKHFKAHYYTQGKFTIFQIYISLSFLPLLPVYFGYVFFPITQVQFTVTAPQTATAHHFSSSAMILLYYITQRQTHQKTITLTVPNGTLCSSKSRPSRSSLRLLWCLARVRLPKGETLHSSPAAFLIAPLNPHAAAALLYFNGSSGRPAHCQIIHLQFTRPPKD